MRIPALLGLCGLLLHPSVALAGSPAECARLMRQIHHYEGMSDRAADRDSEMWEARMNTQVELLKSQLLARWPDWANDDQAAREAARQFAEFLKLAGRVALAFFTMGAF